LQLPAGWEASQGDGSGRYERHRPERTPLYRLVEEYYPVFEASGLPRVRYCRITSSGTSRITSNAVVLRMVSFVYGVILAMPNTLIQCFGSALNLTIHFHMLLLDGVYVGGAGSTPRFRSVKAPTNDELAQLTHANAWRVGRCLERQGLLQRDAEHSYLASDAVDGDSMVHLQRHSMHVIACIEDPAVIAKSLAHLNKKVLSAQASLLPKSRAPPQAAPFD